MHQGIDIFLTTTDPPWKETLGVVPSIHTVGPARDTLQTVLHVKQLLDGGVVAGVIRHHRPWGQNVTGFTRVAVDAENCSQTQNNYQDFLVGKFHHIYYIIIKFFKIASEVKQFFLLIK
jgi:hypothetical protein|tara:strand:+ start:194 stop:550 length:357 start_codon:yes stop_codon:yes gene_type:complete